MSVNFIPPMEMLPVQKLPVGAKWTYELKLDGFRMEATRTEGGVILYSRRKKDMTREFREVAKALEYLPPGTVIDGELTALDDRGFPRFNLLQNFRSGASRLVYFAFDILCHKGRDLARRCQCVALYFLTWFSATTALTLQNRQAISNSLNNS